MAIQKGMADLAIPFKWTESGKCPHAPTLQGTTYSREAADSPEA